MAAESEIVQKMTKCYNDIDLLRFIDSLAIYFLDKYFPVEPLTPPPQQLGAREQLPPLRHSTYVSDNNSKRNDVNTVACHCVSSFIIANRNCVLLYRNSS